MINLILIIILVAACIYRVIMTNWFAKLILGDFYWLLMNDFKEED